VVAVVCFGALSVIDLAEQRLPNRITLPLAGATMVAVLVGGTIRSDLEAAIGAIGVGLGFGLVLLVMQFGMGDVKLALSVGTITGWLGGNAVLAAAVVGATSGAVVALALMIIHRRRDLSFSFGPFLAIGCVAGMLVSGP
jgi:leader peptidase (prepilin peptidase)/N-methyltransferase